MTGLTSEQKKQIWNEIVGAIPKEREPWEMTVRDFCQLVKERGVKMGRDAGKVKLDQLVEFGLLATGVVTDRGRDTDIWKIAEGVTLEQVIAVLKGAGNGQGKE